MRSLLVDDVADLLAEGWADAPRRRELGAAGWPAPTRADRARGRALRRRRRAARRAAGHRPPHAPAALGPLRERHTWSASQLEVWASCPVKWFVERHLRPEALVPDPEPMIRGELAHRVLESRCRRWPPTAACRPSGCPRRARSCAPRSTSTPSDYKISPNPERLRSALRRLEVDLVRYLEFAAHAGSAFAPARFEVQFGNAEDPHPPLELRRRRAAPGGADRPRRRGCRAAARPSSTTTRARPRPSRPSGWRRASSRSRCTCWPCATCSAWSRSAASTSRWAATEARPRGAVLRDADPGLAAFAHRPRRPEAARGAAATRAPTRRATAVAEIRAGALEPRPDACAYAGGCAHPTICRCVSA